MMILRWFRGWILWDWGRDIASDIDASPSIFSGSLQDDTEMIPCFMLVWSGLGEGRLDFAETRPLESFRNTYL